MNDMGRKSAAPVTVSVPTELVAAAAAGRAGGRRRRRRRLMVSLLVQVMIFTMIFPFQVVVIWEVLKMRL
jgi:hypothetical protein